MKRAQLFLTLVLMTLLVTACSLLTPLPTAVVMPTSVRTDTPPIPPTDTPTAPPTATATPTRTPFPSPTVSPTLATPSTPLPGWLLYNNEYLGYYFYYPPNATISEQGFTGMDVNEPVPAGLTFEQYFDYLERVLPKNLCVTIGTQAGGVTIRPPDISLGKYTSPCPGMGIGTGYRFEDSTETFNVGGKIYTVTGTKLYWEDTGAFDSEFYVIRLYNGFTVTLIGGARDLGLSYEDYLPYKETLLQVLSTLFWPTYKPVAVPTMTCAGVYTRLLPGMYARVVDDAAHTPNRVRSGPSAADEIITQIYPGTIVKVLEGPVCSGLVYWKVESNSIPGGVGWTAEGDGANYWLEPYQP